MNGKTHAYNKFWEMPPALFCICGKWEAENSTHSLLSRVYAACWQHSKCLLLGNLAAETTLGSPSLHHSPVWWKNGHQEEREKTPKHTLPAEVVTKFLCIFLHVLHCAIKGRVNRVSWKIKLPFACFSAQFIEHSNKSSRGRLSGLTLLDDLTLICCGSTVKLHSRSKACSFGLQSV